MKTNVEILAEVTNETIEFLTKLRPEGLDVSLSEALTAMDKLREQMQGSKWISVEERLPEPYKEVLVTDGIETRSGFYDSEFKKMEMRKKYQLKSVTHWQPLPEPPTSLTKF